MFTSPTRFSGKFFICLAVFVTIDILGLPAAAQSFTNSIIIGDSNSDNGRYSYLPDPISVGTHTPGVYTTSPGLMWTQALGQKFGIAVTPSDAPGGGNNYAAGGATVAIPDGGEGSADYTNEWSATQQVAAYLSSVNGQADPNALYTVYIGNNDLHSYYNLAPGLPNLVDSTISGGAPNPLSLSQRDSDIIALAGQTASLVGQLHSAGARYILVPGDFAPASQAVATAINYTGATGAAFDPSVPAAVQLYNATMWQKSAATGADVIPADFFTVANYVALNPAQFGITNTNFAMPVCGAVAAINCTPADWTPGLTGSNSLFADYNGHLAAAGQQIEADYSYGLIIAPVQISMLANQAFLEQIYLNDSYMDHIAGSFRSTSPNSPGFWVLGGDDQANISNTTSGTHANANNEAIGADYQLNPHMLVGGLFDYNQTRVDYGGGGTFDQTGANLGVYLGYQASGFWIDGMANYTWLQSAVNRLTPIGITNFSNNTSSIGGSDVSTDIETGYTFHNQTVEHGPLVGYSYVNTDISSFTESGNFNSLHFNSQSLGEQMIEAGYKVQLDLGAWDPSLKATYNHIVGEVDRNVTASLTTVSAPSYYMPAVTFGKSWFNVTAGLGYKINDKTTLQASFTDRIDQSSLETYGGDLSVIMHF